LDFTPIIKSAFGAMWWIIPFLILAMFLKSSKFIGAMGEAQLKLAAKLRLPADTYHAIHNVTLTTEDEHSNRPYFRIALRYIRC